MSGSATGCSSDLDDCEVLTDILVRIDRSLDHFLEISVEEIKIRLPKRLLGCRIVVSTDFKLLAIALKSDEAAKSVYSV